MRVLLTVSLRSGLASLRGLRNVNHTQTPDLVDVYGKFVYEDNLISRRYPETKKSPKPFQSKNKGLVAKTFDWDEKEVSDDEEITPVKYDSPSKQILKAKAKPYPPYTHYGFIDYRLDDCQNYPECAISGSYEQFTSGHNRVILVRGGVLAESSQSSESLIGVSCNTCGSNVPLTSDHNDFEHFKGGNSLQWTACSPKESKQTLRQTGQGSSIGNRGIISRNPLVLTGIVESDSEVKVVFDDTANLRTGKDGSDKVYGTNILLEQWRDFYPDNDDYDPYDDYMYENYDLSEHMQSICDDLNITVRGMKKK
uniref:Uncharacterized protein n=1 Tax=Tanacetum cinerariifolium TaxID=118510 RepID=A0A6L2J749_TANCI|nr:hypothetical protein [Tanacetum cinerariifolium]